MDCSRKCDHHASHYSQDGMTCEKCGLFHGSQAPMSLRAALGIWEGLLCAYSRIHGRATGVLLPPNTR